jgi:hypothetical protein
MGIQRCVFCNTGHLISFVAPHGDEFTKRIIITKVFIGDAFCKYYRVRFLQCRLRVTFQKFKTKKIEKI